jgi:O-antigen ligase
MNTTRLPLLTLSPYNRRLLALVCAAQLMLIVLPSLFSVNYTWLISGELVFLALVAFSVERTLLALMALTIVLPAKLLGVLVLPGGFRFHEAILLGAFLFAAIDLLMYRRLNLRRSPIDGAVAIFLLAALLSAGVGLFYGNSLSLVLRDVRFPLYYGTVFLVTSFVDREMALRIFVPVLVLAGLAVSLEYILEFVGAIDLSVGSRFKRVARLQGLSLPIGLIFLVNQYLHDPRRYGRGVLVALAVPMGLAFVLTVGRGMWAAFAIGLVASILRYMGSTGQRRRVGRAVMLVCGVLVLFGTTVFLFQRVTGATVGAHALERSRTFVDFERDVHMLGRLQSYRLAVEAFVEHPLMGLGQGTTLDVPMFNEQMKRYESMTTWTLDSLYLTLLVKTGLVGTLAFLWLLWRVLRLAHETYKTAGDPAARAFAAAATAVIIAMAALGVSDGSMVNGRFALVYATLFGLIAVAGNRRA